MEAPIVSGLKRPASEGLAAGSRQQSDEDGAAAGVVTLSMGAIAWGRRSSGWLASWAARRSISPNSLLGISLLLALCAAAWFSGGAHDGGRGMIAMASWLLVLAAARGLAAYTAPQPAEGPAPAIGADAGTTPGFGWLSAVSAAAAECAIYGGMAAGSQPTTLIGIWPLAVATVISIATSELLGACLTAALGAGDPRESGRTAAVVWWIGRLLGLPAGLRGLVALLAFAIAGAPAALLAVLALEVVSVVTAIAMLGRITPARWWTGPPVTATVVQASASPAQTPAARVTAVVGVPGSPGASSAVRLIAPDVRGAAAGDEGSAGSTALQTGEARGQAGRSRPAREAGAQVTSEAAVQAAALQATAQDVIVALRDDGPAARWAGRLVQGNLMPLVPAIGGLVATATLAALGLRNVPGLIALAPPVVMMLAAPGSSHRHDGRFDWLVPVLLALAQYVYLATLGFALGVPRPIVFSACAVIMLWYASLIAGVGSPRPSHGMFLGWETRMFAIGFAAAFGLASFGYLGLSTCLGVFICRRAPAG